MPRRVPRATATSEQPAAAPRSAPALASGFTVLCVSTGVNFAFGILFKPMVLDLGWDRSTLALAATASLVVNALGQPVCGSLVDRFGPRRVILPSLALMTAGTGLVSVATAPWELVVLYGVVVGVGYTGAGILPVSIHISRWFPARRERVMALAASGFSLGHLLFTQLAGHVASALGWRPTYLVLAGVLLAYLPLAALSVRDAPAQPGAPSATPGDSLSVDRRAALATPAFWALTLGLMGCGFTDFLMTTHLAPFATDLGLTPAVAANAVSLWAAANIGGILGAGWLAGRIGTRWALVATYLVRACSLLVLLGTGGTAQLYLFAVLFGATFFTTAPLSALLIGQLFGPTHQGVIFGAANLFHHSAGALGAYAGGLTFDLVGSYTPIFLASVAAVIGSALATTLARPRAALARAALDAGRQGVDR